MPAGLGIPSYSFSYQSTLHPSNLEKVQVLLLEWASVRVPPFLLLWSPTWSGMLWNCFQYSQIHCQTEPHSFPIQLFLCGIRFAIFSVFQVLFEPLQPFRRAQVTLHCFFRCWR